MIAKIKPCMEVFSNIKKKKKKKPCNIKPHMEVLSNK
jgi:hypothetical protein